MNLEDLLFLLNNNKNTIVNLEVRLTEAKLSRHNGLGVIHLPKGVIVFKGHKFEEKCDVITLQVNLVIVERLNIGIHTFFLLIEFGCRY